MKKFLLIALLIVIFAAWVGYTAFSSAGTSGAQYVSPETFKGWLTSNTSIVIDVQPYSAYVKKHFPGSYATYAYPVTSPQQKQQLDNLLPMIKKSEKPVVLVCPGGITGAPNARLHLLERGIPNKRLYILKGGTWGWPWKNMFVSGGK